jgi:hypothetical protein
MIDRSAPGLRLTSLASERARSGAPVDLSGRVLRFVFDDDSGKADKVTLELDNHDLALFDRPDLRGGALWEVAWGYAGAMAPPRRVVVRKLTGFETLSLEAHSLGVLLDGVARTRTFTRLTRGEVAVAIAREHGYDGPYVDVDLAGPVEDTLVQAGETDARFLRRLAARDGRLFFVDAQGVHFRRHRPARQVTHTFVWRADANLLSVRVESNLAARVGKVEVRAHDPMTKRTVTATATKDSVARPTLGDVVEVVDPESGKTALERRIATATVIPGSSSHRAQADADAAFLGAEHTAIKLAVQVVGDASLHAGALVRVDGISSRLSGLYHARAVRHAIGADGYLCDLTLVRDGLTASGAGATRPPAPRQGGQPTRPPTAVPGMLTPVESVDPETGRTHITFQPEPRS